METKELIKIETRNVAGEVELFTTSLNVAEVTGKRHDNVIATIRKMIKERPEINGPRFKEGSYLDKNQQLRPMFNIYKRGTITLLFRMTGEKAYAFQEVYMDSFDEMEAALKIAKSKMTALLKDYPSALRALADAEEAKQAQVQLPDFTDPAAAAIAWAEEYRRKQLAEERRLAAKEKGVNK